MAVKNNDNKHLVKKKKTPRQQTSISRPKKVVWSEQGNASTQAPSTESIQFFSLSILFYEHLCYKKDHIFFTCVQEINTKPTVTPTLCNGKLYNAMYWNAAIDQLLIGGEWSHELVFGGSNKPTQGGLTLQIVTMVPSCSYKELRLTCLFSSTNAGKNAVH